MKIMNVGRKYLYQEEAGDGAGGGNWRDSLPEDIKANASLANFSDVGQMAKSFIEMKSYQGNSIHVPGEDAGDEARIQFTQKLIDKAPNVMLKPDFNNAEQSVEFFRTLGMPEKAEGYEFTPPEGAPINDAKLAQFRELAHEIGLTKSQFTNFITKITESDVAEVTAAVTAQKDAMGELNKEWGMATQERIDAAISIAERTKAPDHLIDSIKKGNLSPDMVKWVHSLSVSIGNEGNNLGDLPNNQTGKMTPGEAKEKIAEIYDNKTHPFHRGDATAMKQMISLVAASNPGSSTDINDLRTGMSFGA